MTWQTRYTTASVEETNLLAKKLAHVCAALPCPCIVLLFGSLGSGKTTLTKGIISELVALPSVAISSPTFQYVSLYTTTFGSQVAHFDLWRLSSPEDFFSMGLDEILESSYSFVEWPERLGVQCPAAQLSITLRAISESERVFDIWGAEMVADACTKVI